MGAPNGPNLTPTWSNWCQNGAQITVFRAALKTRCPERCFLVHFSNQNCPVWHQKRSQLKWNTFDFPPTPTGRSVKRG